MRDSTLEKCKETDSVIDDGDKCSGLVLDKDQCVEVGELGCDILLNKAKIENILPFPQHTATEYGSFRNDIFFVLEGLNLTSESLFFEIRAKYEDPQKGMPYALQLLSRNDEKQYGMFFVNLFAYRIDLYTQSDEAEKSIKLKIVFETFFKLITEFYFLDNLNDKFKKSFTVKSLKNTIEEYLNFKGTEITADPIDLDELDIDKIKYLVEKLSGITQYQLFIDELIELCLLLDAYWGYIYVND